MNELETLVEPTLRGDPMSPLRWTCKSTANLSRELKNRGYEISARTISGLLKELNYRLQGNRKSHEGKGHPDRNTPFEFINQSVKRFHQEGNPVISVDAQKKELIGNFKNSGKQWGPQGTPDEGNVYDFLSLGPGRATPYGALDLFRKEGWVSVGMGIGFGSENGNCNAWRTKPEWKFAFVTFRRERANGTKSNTGCSPVSA